MPGAAILVVCNLALAQIAPGPVTEAHAEWDTPIGCFSCHKILGKVTNDKCWNCHAHEALQKAVEEGHGLHARFGKRRCIECHTEHKGRNYNIVDWTTVGGRKRFKHQRTGFPLTGAHANVDCTTCHKKKFRSGRTSFTGLEKTCESCHKNPHGFTKESLKKDCDKCHVPGIPAKKLRPRNVPFDHAKEAGVALVGRHGRAKCRDCHKDGKMSARDNPRSCTSCHKNVHGKTFLTRPCSDCHHPKRSFKKPSFDHAKAGFPLLGKHKRVNCSRCHVKKDVKPSRKCDGCHSDPHGGRFKALACDQCHPTGGMSSRGLDHGAALGFALTGKHAKLRCRTCHRARGPKKFEKHASKECGDCHAHKKAHDGQFGDTPCLNCHTEGGTSGLDFDHNTQTRFPLEGRHAELKKRRDCRKCHPKGQYRHGRRSCSDCHKDPHKGQFSDRCDRCHDAAVKFNEIRFDHQPPAASFTLAGKHLEVKCAKCHPKRKYKIGAKSCIDCHAKDDRHGGKLGTNCGKCHTPERGATLFDHASMAEFPLVGRHQSTGCGYCHRPPLAEGPPPRNWTQGAEAPKGDLAFPVMGKDCAECHRDHHEGAYGERCDSCHDTTSFDNVRAMIHDTGAFRLAGTHKGLPCSECHNGKTIVDGLGETCQTCHWDDDAHNNGLGPYCGDCHTQLDWRPARFSHIETGFALRGRHRFVECRACHRHGVYQGAPRDCDLCHTHDALRVADPIHNSELLPCDRCHSEVGFLPARNSHTLWPLVGRHRFVGCGNCHPTGMYVGTPGTCVDCHLNLYYSSTSRDHVTQGDPFTCDDCHTPVGWTPAVTPP